MLVCKLNMHCPLCDESCLWCVEYEPLISAKWIEHEWAENVDEHLISNFECSSCQEWKREKTNFCPNCGAKMLNPS